MLGALAKKIFGSANDRRLKTYGPKVAAINALEPEIAALSDEALRARTDALKAELAAGKTLDDILVPAFATVREAAKRTPRPAPFRRPADRRHGAARGRDRRDEDRRGQDAGRDAAGLPERARRARASTSSPSTTTWPAATRNGWARSTASSASRSASSCTGSTTTQRRAAYACDITYGTNNEFGFDYLRDNMKYEFAQMVQRGHNFAIVDEVDSILIDEARTPLIISGPLDDRSDLYIAIDAIMPKLAREDYDLDEKQRTVVADRERQREDRGAAARGRTCSRRATSTTPATSRSSTTSTRRCAPTSCSSATRTTSSATARSSSSTSSPAA